MDPDPGPRSHLEGLHIGNAIQIQIGLVAEAPVRCSGYPHSLLFWRRAQTEGTTLTCNGSPERFVRSIAIDLARGQVLTTRHQP